MPWGAATWMEIMPELGYGIYNGAGTPWYPTLFGGNAFTMRKVPQRQVIRTADGGNRRKFVVSNRKVFAGTLNTLLHPDQCAQWVTALSVNGTIPATGTVTLAGTTVGSVAINGGGSGYPTSSTIPVSFIGGGGSGAYGTATASGGIVTSVAITAAGTGYTSIPGVQIGGMPSYSLMFWDGIQSWRFLGACIASATITGNPNTDYTTLSLNWIAQQRDATFTTFAAPAETVYSTVLPYQYIETAGNITVGAAHVPLSMYRMASVTLTNQLKPTWDESQYITSLMYAGRDLDFSVGPQMYTNTWRAAFEAQTPLQWVINFTRSSPSHSLTITCETNTYLSNVTDDIPLDGPAYQALAAEVFYDASQTNDFVLAAT